MISPGEIADSAFPVSLSPSLIGGERIEPLPVMPLYMMKSFLQLCNRPCLRPPYDTRPIGGSDNCNGPTVDTDRK